MTFCNQPQKQSLPQKTTFNRIELDRHSLFVGLCNFKQRRSFPQLQTNPLMSSCREDKGLGSEEILTKRGIGSKKRKCVFPPKVEVIQSQKNMKKIWKKKESLWLQAAVCPYVDADVSWLIHGSCPDCFQAANAVCPEASPAIPTSSSTPRMPRHKSSPRSKHPWYVQRDSHALP